MKGYTEERGQAYKLEFDAVSGRFVLRPIVHAFTLEVPLNAVVQKLVELRKRGHRKRTKRNLSKLLANMSSEARDAVGMTEAFATSSQN